ncbi:LysR substrate binding domain protein [Necator americanus]|uniref:LysR substrate binding domain protein n=2 Tax=cellular organisms TaxID=131567 RepID=W2U001_NECAM|nr:LysR substrate binding domain protein [Necator americanus]ETN86622.1 LysR substrate binding domain protein [Necator americanus]
MEDAVGVCLFSRERLGVTMTDAGVTLLRHARTLLTSMQKMSDDLDQFANGLRGTVRLLANTHALTEYLPVPVGHFLASHPNVNIEIEERPSNEIISALMDGIADIGIVAATSDNASLQTFPFATDRLCAIVPASRSAFAGQADITLGSLLDSDFIGYTSGSALQSYIADHAQRIHRKIRQRIELGSFEAICRLVENDVGVSIVPQSAARRYKRTMAIRVLSLDEEWALRDMRVCVLDRASMPAYSQQLLAHLVANASPDGVSDVFARAFDKTEG